MKIENYLEALNDLSHHESLFRKSVEEISLLEYRVLDLVFDGPLCLKMISRTRGVAPQAIGRVCARLSRRGILNIERDERDGRAKRVSLTQEGIALHGKGTEALEEIIAEYDLALLRECG